MVICRPRQVEDMGYSTLALLLPATDIKIADGSPNKVLVALLVKISGHRGGVEFPTSGLFSEVFGVWST